jgi:hypothetical protein
VPSPPRVPVAVPVGGSRLAAKPPYVSPGPIADDESDQLITAVKSEQQGEAPAAPRLVSIVDPDSELPTEPRHKQAARDPDRGDAPGAGTLKASPARQVIPATPGIPQRPFQGFDGPRAGPKPEAPAEPLERAEPVGDASPSFDPARASGGDEVEVIDRAALMQMALLTEDGLIAEADRLAIEAVRRGEEARGAQLRAERKAASARIATDAAQIAAEAVRMVRTAGIAAAAKRLEDARVLEQSLQAGKLGGTTGEARPGATGSTFPGALDGPSISGAGMDLGRAAAALAPFPGIDAARAHAIAGIPPPQPLSVPPPPLSAPPPYLPQLHEVARPATLPQSSLSGLEGAPVLQTGPVPGGYGAAPDDDAFRARLQPQILGVPSTVFVGLAVTGVFWRCCSPGEAPLDLGAVRPLPSRP